MELADVAQTKHIVGSAAYAALALELDQGGETEKSDELVQWAIEHAPREAREVLVKMSPRIPGKSRLDRLMFEIDAGLRGLEIFRYIYGGFNPSQSARP